MSMSEEFRKKIDSVRGEGYFNDVVVAVESNMLETQLDPDLQREQRAFARQIYAQTDKLIDAAVAIHQATDQEDASFVTFGNTVLVQSLRNMPPGELRAVLFDVLSLYGGVLAHPEAFKDEPGELG